jgi:ABC-type polar amino acid transport system ATPase subunit
MNQLAAVMLEQVGLGEHQHKYPEHLSGGQKQRVAISLRRAMVDLNSLKIKTHNKVISYRSS